MRPIAALLVIVSTGVATAQESRPDRDRLDAAIARGLAFLAKDAMEWKEEHQCVSCHHAGLVVWSLREAKRRGHAVDEPVLAELTTWMASSSGDGKTGVPRPEERPRALNAKALWLALGLGADAEPDAAVKEGLRPLLETITSDQTQDGSWSSWPETRPPIFGNSDESMTALAALALLPGAANGDEAARVAGEKAVRWLEETKTDDDPQALAMRLVLWKRLGRTADECRPLVERIQEHQNADGGWSQAQGMRSDAWATGQALYALAHAGISAADPAVARGRSFLIQTQREDGSWPMTSRPTKPGGEGAKSLVPITAAGSSWAVLGLVRSR